MSEKSELDLDLDSGPDGAKERVGDVLRRERKARQITLEIIARDLRLNIGYLKALEANDYNSLPADPYIRVYVRSLAKYLQLDPEELLKRFAAERGIVPEEPHREIRLVPVNVEKAPAYRPWLIVLGVIAALAAVSLMFNKTGKGFSRASANRSSPLSASKKPAPESAGKAAAPADSAEDNLMGALTHPGNDSVAGANESGPVDTAKLVLQIKALKDSAWVQVFHDGQSWKNFIRGGQSKIFTARDSFNVRAGNNSHLTYILNNKPLVIGGKDVAIFKLTRTAQKPEMWTEPTWASVFKNR